MNSLVRGWKTVRQVGLKPVLQVALYRFGLVTGHYRRVTPPDPTPCDSASFRWKQGENPRDNHLLTEFYATHSETAENSKNEANLVFQGKCRIFGSQTVDIFRDDIDVSRHWTDFERGIAALPEKDVKFIWEPARLGWVYPLCRAKATGKLNEAGPKGFSLIESFLQKNPVNCGPNWMNGQEVALRILALVFFHEVFKDDPGMQAGWDQTLAQAVLDHARRIPPTLVYARSQQNNHLLVEAAGLYTAGVFLPDSPDATLWKAEGWKVFHQALDDQIEDDGTYAQYSTNYHRLMLQIALWVKAVSRYAGDEFPPASKDKLAAATNWLTGLTMPETGRVPNYGHNDGAYILPLTARPYHDFRPVVQAANREFGVPQMDDDVDEMSLWFDWLSGGTPADTITARTPVEIRSYRKLLEGSTTVFIFTPRFTRRPGQADLLHTEVWRDGEALLLDPGTYQYNADPPWENALSGTRVHNTVSLAGKDQMVKAGRFLWLDWPNVTQELEEPGGYAISVSHDGYRRDGILHRRRVELVSRSLCRIFDEVTYTGRGKPPEKEIWLHWLLPPLHFSNTNAEILTMRMEESKPEILLSITTGTGNGAGDVEHQRVRAGGIVYTSCHVSRQPEDTARFGWYSPTYGVKEPAISYRVIVKGQLPVTFVTEIQV